MFVKLMWKFHVEIYMSHKFILVEAKKTSNIYVRRVDVDKAREISCRNTQGKQVDV